MFLHRFVNCPRGRKVFLGVFSLACSLVQLRAQSWTNRYTGPAQGVNEATAIVVDGGGNAYVTGTATGVNGNLEWATIKYSAGGTALWTNVYAGPGDGTFSKPAITCDQSSNVYVAGGAFDALGNGDFTTVAYSSSGTTLWTSFYHGPGLTGDYAVAVATSNNIVYVTGVSAEATAGNSDYATLAYTSAGVPLWTNRYNGAGNGPDSPTGLAIDGIGNVYVTGSSIGSAENYEYATVAYSSAGIPLWTNVFVGSAEIYDAAAAIATDGANHVYVTGVTTSLNSDEDYATIAYTRAGVALWTNIYNDPANGDDEAAAIKVDSQHNIIVTGSSMNGTNWDYVTIKYASTGAGVWTNIFGGGNANDSPNALAVDPNGNVYVTGEMTGTNGVEDYLTVFYSSAGALVRMNGYSGPAHLTDDAEAIAVDANGNAVVTGYSAANSYEYDYATIKYAFPLFLINNDGSLGFSNGYFGFNVLGPPGLPVMISASSNMVNWSPVWTNAAGGTFYFSDPQAGTNRARFYRAAFP